MFRVDRLRYNLNVFDILNQSMNQSRSANVEQQQKFGSGVYMWATTQFVTQVLGPLFHHKQ